MSDRLQRPKRLVPVHDFLFLLLLTFGDSDRPLLSGVCQSQGKPGQKGLPTGQFARHHNNLSWEEFGESERKSKGTRWGKVRLDFLILQCCWGIWFVKLQIRIWYLFWHDGIVPKRNKSETVLSVKGFIPKFLPQSGITPKSNNSERCHTLE